MSLRVGDPGEAILVLERELNVSLIVMATHGRSGLGRLLLGSVADRVAHASRAPVVILRPGEPSTEQLRTILVPVDGTAAEPSPRHGRTGGARVQRQNRSAAGFGV